MATTCPSCENSYSKIGMHWTLSDCDVSPTPRQQDILVGLLLGDGTITTTGRNPALHVNNTNKEFLEWVDGELGVFSNGVKLHATGDQLAEYNDSNGVTNDQYIIRTPSNKWFKRLDAWYSSGEKVFPDIKLNPLISSVWYCCDGTLDTQKGSHRAMISAENERGNESKIINMFHNVPVTPSVSGKTIYFSVDDTLVFLDWVEGPLPGFEYKW